MDEGLLQDQASFEECWNWEGACPDEGELWQDEDRPGYCLGQEEGTRGEDGFTPDGEE